MNRKISFQSLMFLKLTGTSCRGSLLYSGYDFGTVFKIFSIQFFGGKFYPKICCSSNCPWIHFHLLIFILIFIFSLCIVSLPQADNHKHTFKLFRWKYLYWNHTSSWVFPWNFAAYFQNTFGGLLPNARLCCLKLSVFGTVFNPLVPGVNLKVTHT